MQYLPLKFDNFAISCLDYDECKEKHPCDKNAHCLKFPGEISFACQCDTEKDRFKLMIIARITMKKLFLAKDIDFIDIQIIGLKIGSLIIEYVVILDTQGVKNKTLPELNPVEKDTVVFEDVSHYKGRIQPAYSYISGKYK